MIKGGGAFWCPDEGHPLFEEVQEGPSNVSKAKDKGAVVSQDTKHGMHFFDQFQGLQPFCNSGDLAGVDTEGFAIL